MCGLAPAMAVIPMPVHAALCHSISRSNEEQSGAYALFESSRHAINHPCWVARRRAQEVAEALELRVQRSQLRMSAGLAGHDVPIPDLRPS